MEKKMSEESYEKYSRENQFTLRSRKSNTNYGSSYSLANAIELAKNRYSDADEISFYKKLYDGTEEQYFLKKNDSDEWVVNHISVK
jgi:hypothetical protein